MIIDTLENIGRYSGLGKHMARAAAFLRETELRTLPLGKGEVDGQQVYYLSQDNLLNRGEAAWEAHDRYADIQLILAGEERMGWGVAGCVEPPEGESDFRVCREVQGFDFTVKAGQFALFLPGEAHAPGRYAGAAERCRKIVVKVRMEEKE